MNKKFSKVLLLFLVSFVGQANPVIIPWPEVVEALNSEGLFSNRENYSVTCYVSANRPALHSFQTSEKELRNGINFLKGAECDREAIRNNQELQNKRALVLTDLKLVISCIFDFFVWNDLPISDPEFFIALGKIFNQFIVHLESIDQSESAAFVKHSRMQSESLLCIDLAKLTFGRLDGDKAIINKIILCLKEFLVQYRSALNCLNEIETKFSIFQLPQAHNLHTQLSTEIWGDCSSLINKSSFASYILQALDCKKNLTPETFYRFKRQLIVVNSFLETLRFQLNEIRSLHFEMPLIGDILCFSGCLGTGDPDVLMQAKTYSPYYEADPKAAVQDL